MKREIKFRGKVEIGVKEPFWIYGDLVRFNEKSCIHSLDENGYHRYTVNSDSVGQFTGLQDKNGKDIYYNGQLLRIKGVMGEKGEYSFDCVYKTNEVSFEGLSLSFVKLFNEEPDSKQNSFPISQYPSFSNGALGWRGEHRLILRDTYGENNILRHTWKEHHQTEDIEIIENIYDNPELLK